MISFHLPSVSHTFHLLVQTPCMGSKIYYLCHFLFKHHFILLCIHSQLPSTASTIKLIHHSLKHPFVIKSSLALIKHKWIRGGGATWTYKYLQESKKVRNMIYIASPKCSHLSQQSQAGVLKRKLKANKYIWGKTTTILYIKLIT